MVPIPDRRQHFNDYRTRKSATLELKEKSPFPEADTLLCPNQRQQPYETGRERERERGESHPKEKKCMIN